MLLAGERVRACDVILRKHRRHLPSPVGRRQLSGAPGEVRSFKFSGSMDPNQKSKKEKRVQTQMVAFKLSIEQLLQPPKITASYMQTY